MNEKNINLGRMYYCLNNFSDMFSKNTQKYELISRIKFIYLQNYYQVVIKAILAIENINV